MCPPLYKKKKVSKMELQSFIFTEKETYRKNGKARKL